MTAVSMTTLRDVFKVCQNRPNAFERGLGVMRKEYAETPFEEFFSDLKHVVMAIIPNSESSEYVERLIDLTAQFIAAPYPPPDSNELVKTENPLFSSIIRCAIEWSMSSHRLVRERSCKLIDKALRYVGQHDDFIDQDLFDDLETSMMSRLKDRIGTVRAFAVGSLSRLQDPRNAKCKIVEAYLFHLSHDPCVDVRSAILANMVPSTRALEAILQRTRDVKDVVRKLAFERIAEKIPVKCLTMKQRTALVQSGLNDSSVGVKAVVSQKLIPAWLKPCEGKVVDLLRMLDIYGSEEAIETLLNALLNQGDADQIVADFARDYLDEDKLIPADKLTRENSVCWKSLALQLRARGSSESEALLDTVLPDTTTFCGYVVNFLLSYDASWDALQHLEHRFISQQLLLLATAADLSDNAGRSRLRETVRKLLLCPKLDSMLIPQLVRLVRQLFPNPDATLQEVADIVTEIPLHNETLAAPTETREQPSDMVVAKMRVQLNILREEMASCVEDQDFSRAHEVKQKVKELEETLQQRLHEVTNTCEEEEEEKEDGDNLAVVAFKRLTLITETLAGTPLNSLAPFLRTCLDDIVLPGIVKLDPAFRKQATRALALCCLLNKQVALQNMQLLFQIALVDQPQIQVVALGGALDLMLAYGIDTFGAVYRSIFEGEEDEGEDPLPQKEPSALVVDFLLKCIDAEDNGVCAVAAEGMAKLQLYGHIYSPRLVSVMILRWMDPNTDPNSRFHEILRTFIMAYSMGNPRNLQCFEEAFLSTLRAVTSAPPSSPMARLDPADVLNFLVDVTLPRSAEHPGRRLVTVATEATPHDRLAEKLCSEVLRDPCGSETLVFLKALTLLEVTDQAALADLLPAARKMESKVKTKRGIALAKKFKEKLMALSSVSTIPDGDPASSSSAAIESVTSSSDLSLVASSKYRRHTIVMRNKLANMSVYQTDSSASSSGRHLVSSQDLFPSSSGS